MVSLLRIFRLNVFLDMKNIVCAAPPGAISNWHHFDWIFYNFGPCVLHCGKYHIVYCSRLKKVGKHYECDLFHDILHFCFLHRSLLEKQFRFARSPRKLWMFGLRSCFWTTNCPSGAGILRQLLQQLLNYQIACQMCHSIQILNSDWQIFNSDWKFLKMSWLRNWTLFFFGGRWMNTLKV
jgi:hypothetical protein